MGALSAARHMLMQKVNVSRQFTECMRKIFGFLIVAALMAFVACRGDINKEKVDKNTGEMPGYEAVGDSTVYGLVCGGGTEAYLVVFFPETGENPDTFDISDARKNGNVFGFPNIGDRFALVLNPDDKKSVSKAINLNELMGTWVYSVMPHLRSSFDPDILAAMDKEERAKFDHLIDSFMVPREYGFTMKIDNQVLAIGTRNATYSQEKESPVEYPRMKRYSEWHIFNGDIILTEVSRASETDKEPVVRNDTAQLVYLRKDTMALKVNGEVQGYRLRPDSLTH